MFAFTDTDDAPWTVIKSNDKRRARLEAMRVVLCDLDYSKKDTSVVGKPDSQLVGPPGELRDEGEESGSRRSGRRGR